MSLISLTTLFFSMPAEKNNYQTCVFHRTGILLPQQRDGKYMTLTIMTEGLLNHLEAK